MKERLKYLLQIAANFDKVRKFIKNSKFHRKTFYFGNAPTK